MRIALRCLDPEGVTGRKKHRLNRRKYFCKVQFRLKEILRSCINNNSGILTKVAEGGWFNR